MSRPYSILLFPLFLSACQTPTDLSSFTLRSESHASGTTPRWKLKINHGVARYSDAEGKVAANISAEAIHAFDRSNSFQSDKLSFHVTYAPCRDGRSVQSYSAIVTVAVRDVIFRGCGGNKMKANQLDGSQWRVTSLNGSVLPPTQLIEVRFNYGRMIAITGCNRYSADYSIKSNKIRIGQPQIRKVYCDVSEEISDQQFIDMIGGETEFEFLRDGNLSITNRIDRKLLLKQTI